MQKELNSQAFVLELTPAEPMPIQRRRQTSFPSYKRNTEHTSSQTQIPSFSQMNKFTQGSKSRMLRLESTLTQTFNPILKELSSTR
jgi:hypothetical protein